MKAHEKVSGPTASRYKCGARGACCVCCVCVNVSVCLFFVDVWTVFLGQEIAADIQMRCLVVGASISWRSGRLLTSRYRFHT
jgi:hypothetical protein